MLDTQLLLKPFIRYIVQEQDPIYVIMPPKADIEDYSMSLENMIMECGGSLSNKIHYIAYENMLNEIPTFLDNVIMDPRCYQYKLQKYERALKQIRETLKNV